MPARYGFAKVPSDQNQETTVLPPDSQSETTLGHSPVDSIHTIDSEATTLWSPTGKLSFENKKVEDEVDEGSARTSEDADQFLGDSDDGSPIERPTTPVIEEESQKFPPRRKTATWRELPKKGQLALLVIARLSEPLSQTSLQSYMFYQLKSFDPSLSDATVSAQAGWMAAAFTALQFCTAFMWGRAADSERLGRKTVVLIGLLGTMIASLGFGFASTFATAIIFRCVGGALNGNVGVMRVVSRALNLI